MKLLLGCLLSLLLAASALRAQQDEIPVFDLDEYLLDPKMKISIGFRALAGQKASFSGAGGVTGLVQSTQAFGALDAVDVRRSYHDGYVAQNTRVDDDGNPIVDGRTNNWLFVDEKQHDADAGLVAFNAYSAAVTDNETRNLGSGNSYGAELIVARDMGKIGRRAEWTIFAGLSLNSINESTRDTLMATVTTVTDRYSLNGQTLPNVPYSAPSTSLDENGNVINTTVLLGLNPDSRTTTVTTDVPVSAYWKLKGAYLAARAGPSLTYNIRDNLRLSFSAGAALAYVGTSYTVEHSFQPETSDLITSEVVEYGEDLLTGYYVDATLEYFLAERAALYFGAFYQSNGEYDQSMSDPAATYSTRLDLSRLQGFRAGLNYRF
ncbi:MAG: hypothetical protein KIT44_07325 [Opitutaceae bacterium]|nr:hypothetical protein [Opitutaceae bacterium]